MDATGVGNLFEQIHERWVQPEITKRQATAQLGADFKIRRCLIKLPQGQDPIVEFNEEISWLATVRKPKDLGFNAGDPVFLSQIERVETVEPPTVDGKRVSFFYVYFSGVGWQIVFDCTPNLPPDRYELPDAEDWDLGKSIAELINLELQERAIHLHDQHQAAVQSIGLWAAPALLPYPLSAIADKCEKGSLAEAREILIKHCSTDFLSGRVGQWCSVKAFADRALLFREALVSHREGRYSQSIHSLVPHIEGVVTDWIYSKMPAGAAPHKQKSKTEKLRELLDGGASRTFAEQRVQDSIIDFILCGPVLETFRDWLAPVSDTFPNRHVIGHGRYSHALYTEENSIKAFLAMDTLHHIMS
jgi:hypothetical protein